MSEDEREKGTNFITGPAAVGCYDGCTRAVLSFKSKTPREGRDEEGRARAWCSYTHTLVLTLSRTYTHSYAHSEDQRIWSISLQTYPIWGYGGVFKKGANAPQFWSLGTREGGVGTLPGSADAAANLGDPVSWPTAAPSLSWPSPPGSPALPAGLGRDEVSWRGSRGALCPVGAEVRG